MKSELFAELIESAHEALAHSKGKQELRTTVLPGAPKVMGADDVRALRERVNASQSVFAHFLNVSTKLVQAWEANRRRPEGAALRLLEIASENPGVVFRGTSAQGKRRSGDSVTPSRKREIRPVSAARKAAVKRVSVSERVSVSS